MFPQSLGLQRSATSYRIPLCPVLLYVIPFPAPCMDINSYCVPQHAKRGGHGASKKKIGSRGTDKVCFIVCSFLPCPGDWVYVCSYAVLPFSQ